MRERATLLGKAIRAEDGVGNAVNIIRQHLGACFIKNENYQVIPFPKIRHLMVDGG